MLELTGVGFRTGRTAVAWATPFDSRSRDLEADGNIQTLRGYLCETAPLPVMSGGQPTLVNVVSTTLGYLGLTLHRTRSQPLYAYACVGESQSFV